MLANRKGGALYTGITSDLRTRVFQHKADLNDGFTKRYQVHDLVYFGETNDAESAIAREKCVKAWKRQWKIDLIENKNPEWKDLFPNLV